MACLDAVLMITRASKRLARAADGHGSQHAGAAAARFGVKVGERVWRVNGRAVGEALDFNGVVGLCRQRPVALDLVDAEA